MQKLLVILGAYNGANFIEEQLLSIKNQTIGDIDVVVSDDGSTDRTVEIVQNLAKSWSNGKLAIVSGPRKGFAENYRFLLLNHAQNYRYVAFADQDDIWDEDKLEVALSWLQNHEDSPALYCGRTRYVDEHGQQLGLSPLFSKQPHFRNAITQSLAGGNTMVMNYLAVDAIANASRKTSFISHDWWAYLVVSAVRGLVFYDPTPHLDYRQHSANLVGANASISERLVRIRGLLNGQYRRWTGINLAGLKHIFPLLPEETRCTIADVEELRTGNVFQRLKRFSRSGLYRQTALGSLGLAFAVMFRLL